MIIAGHSGFTRPTHRPGSTESAAMQRLVPGDFPQTEEDLTAFAQPVLDLLSRNGTRVAILAEGQTLAHSPALRTLDREEAAAETPRVNSLVRVGIGKVFATGVNSYQQLEEGADQITRDLRVAGLDHHLGIALSPFPLEALAQAREIPPAHADSWKEAFTQLNDGLVDHTPAGVQAKYGLVVLPHTYHQSRVVPESRLRNAGEVTAEYVEGSLGLNRFEERMVLLHQKFLSSPAPEVGHYRLAIHEVGHALDHALERLTNFPGFGALHRQTVDALFEADQARVGQGVPAESVFTSDRSDDDVREYFAEAVEAYLTPAHPNDEGTFRAGNSKEALTAKNPDLYAYIEKVMTTEFPETAVPELPTRSLVPPGVPDPDLEIVPVS